jgi:hypothetical protein
MRPTKFQRAPLITLCALVLSEAIGSEAQTLPTAPLPTSAPTSPNLSSKFAPTDDLQWSAVGATAQCHDGTFFRGKVDAHSCADHGGVRKLLSGRGQELIR